MRARFAVSDGRRHGDPDILADLGGNGQCRHLAATENLLRTEESIETGVTHGAVLCRRRCKMAHLVKLVVIRQMAFRYKTEKSAVGDRRRRIVNTVEHRDGKSDECEKIQIFGLFDIAGKFPLAGGEKRRLKYQISHRVGGNIQFGENKYLHSGSRRTLRRGDRRVGIKMRVGDPQGRGRRRDTYKSVSHHKLRSAARTGGKK